jgi:effector-binding domain-containing protein
MKALKIIGLIIVLLAIVIGILGALAPKEFKAERSVVVNASADVIFKNINSWDSFAEWNPWREIEPDMKIETEGTNGEVGSVYRWEGKKVGKGEMRKTLVEQNQRIEYDLIFYNPWGESSNKGFMSMEEQGENSYKVTWGFSGKNKFPFNIMGLFMDMDAMIGKDFEKGLEKFKNLSEKQAEEIKTKGGIITKINFPKKKFASIRGKVAFDKIDDFFSTNVITIVKQLTDAKITIDGFPHGIYYLWDTDKKITEMSVAFPVSLDVKSLSKLNLETVAATEAYMLAMRGSYDKMEAAHNSLINKLKEDGYNNPELVLEEYVIGTQQEKDSTKWQTNIYYLVKK